VRIATQWERTDIAMMLARDLGKRNEVEGKCRCSSLHIPCLYSLLFHGLRDASHSCSTAESPRQSTKIRHGRGSSIRLSRRAPLSSTCCFPQIHQMQLQLLSKYQPFQSPLRTTPRDPHLPLHLSHLHHRSLKSYCKVHILERHGIADGRPELEVLPEGWARL
jgi:hypothetical protein